MDTGSQSSPESSIPVPAILRPRLQKLLARRAVIDQELSAYLAGVAAVHGVGPERLIGLDDAAEWIGVRAEAGPPPSAEAI